MADAETRLRRKPIVMAPNVNDALIRTKELGPRYDAPVQPTHNRSSARR
jgi:hypothetical protein